jgi:ABC-type uncharacterized transport system auxiliary subunit
MSNTQMYRRIFRVALVSLGVVSMGCSGLLETQLAPPDTYVLHAAAIASKQAIKTNTPANIAVSIPTPAPGLDTERIATLHDSNRLDYYRDAQWGATAPLVIQTLICDSLAHVGFNSVAPEQARLNSTHLIDLQLRAFQAEYLDESAAPTVRVALVASVLRLSDRKLLASFPVSASVKAEQNTLRSVVSAFESASQHVAAALGTQVEKLASE